MKTKMTAPLETKTIAAVQIEIRRRKCARLLIPLLACVILGTPAKTAAQTFATYPAGDNVTPSLGQFQIVLDQAWVKIFDVIIPNSPLGSVLSTKHIKLYHNGVITSPTLYDPNTLIGRWIMLERSPVKRQAAPMSMKASWSFIPPGPARPAERVKFTLFSNPCTWLIH
jgi:hypothetical protein